MEVRLACKLHIILQWLHSIHVEDHDDSKDYTSGIVALFGYVDDLLLLENNEEAIFSVKDYLNHSLLVQDIQTFVTILR